MTLTEPNDPEDTRQMRITAIVVTIVRTTKGGPT